MTSQSSNSRGKIATLFATELPTLWPSMLAKRGDAAGYFPFSDPQIEYSYFARIAVWMAANRIGLANAEVLVPAYHHGVEIEALVAAGAVPVFYPVGPQWQVDPQEVERLITPRTRALYLTHFAGFPGPTRAMREMADRHGLPLIEDCALSLLSRDGDTPLGSTGDYGIFCLYKTLPVPNGGALVTNEGERAGDERRTTKYRGQVSENSKLKIQNSKLNSIPLKSPPLLSTVSHMASLYLQNLEMRGGAWGRMVRSQVRRLGRETVEVAGIERVTTGSDHFNPEHTNLGMSAWSKRILHAQNVERIRRVRRRNYLYLLRELGEDVMPLLPTLPRGVCPLFYPLIVPDKEQAQERLVGRGIAAVNFWRHSHPSCDLTKFPDVARLRATVLEIPCHQDLSRGAMREIIKNVRQTLREL